MLINPTECLILVRPVQLILTEHFMLPVAELRDFAQIKDISVSFKCTLSEIHWFLIAGEPLKVFLLVSRLELPLNLAKTVGNIVSELFALLLMNSPSSLL